MSRRARIFARAAKAILSKADVPEVERVIALLSRVGVSHWRTTVDQATRDLVDALERIPDLQGTEVVEPVARARDQGRTLDDILAVLLAAFWAALARPLGPARTSIVRDQVDDLLRAGAAALKLLPDPGGGRTVSASQAAVVDFQAVFAGHVESVEAAVRKEVRGFLTTSTARQGDVDTPFDAQKVGPIPAASSKAAWRARLAAVLDVDGKFVEVSVDSWAYRWFNVGSLEAVLAARRPIKALRAFNNFPNGPDERTTSFCWWVHGRVVSIERAVDRLDAYKRAIVEGRLRDAWALWPLQDLPRGGTASSFAEHFERVGIPPYHRRCRTRLEVEFV